MAGVMFTFAGAFSTFTYLRPFLEIRTYVTLPQLSLLLLRLGLAGFVVPHYDYLNGRLHYIGMIRSSEVDEASFALMGDGMHVKRTSDVPMGAMWVVNKLGEIEAMYFNDLQESASVAHIYGQNLVACESLTGGPSFGSAHWDLKPTADALLLAGVNRVVVYTSTRQPISKGPGMTLGVGQHFTRNETWAE